MGLSQGLSTEASVNAPKRDLTSVTCVSCRISPFGCKSKCSRRDKADELQPPLPAPSSVLPNLLAQGQPERTLVTHKELTSLT